MREKKIYTQEIKDKQCSICKSLLPRENFRKCASSWDGLKYYCKTCDDKKAKEHYAANRDKKIELVTKRRRQLCREAKLNGKLIDIIETSVNSEVVVDLPLNP